ncbi:MAG: phasin family protein [Methyloceanibacter sp.]
MSKSFTPKVGAKKTRTTHRTSASKVSAKKAQATHRKPISQIAAEKASNTHRKEISKVATETVRGTHRNVAAKFQEFRARKVAAKFRAPQNPDAMPAFAEGGIKEFLPASAKGRVDHQIEDMHTQVPASMRALAEMSVAQTRAVYQRSANAFDAAFESWEDCLDAAGQGAMALNRKIMDIAERNISTGFDLATRLTKVKNPVEAIELQAAYWRQQFGELMMQAEEVRTLLERVTDSVAEPIKAQVTLDRMPR